MPKFKYKAFDEKKKIIQGTLIEDDLDIARDVMASKDLTIISMAQVTTLSDYSFNRTLKLEQLASFCGEVAIILDSGVSILRGLEILKEQSKNEKYKKIIEKLEKTVKKGQNLSTAMELSGAFPELLVDMVASGEMSSHLVEILFSMEDFYEREASIRSEIRSASIYPIILLAVSIGMVIFFNLFVFSELKSIFEDAKQLPTMTRVVIGGLDYLNNNPLIVIGVIMAVIVLFYLLLQITAIKYLVDKASINVPVIGMVKRQIIYARIASSMAIFIQSAVPLVKVLTVVENIADNKYIGSLLAKSKDEITRGQNISDAFQESGAFDTMMIQMIRIGEETGKLEEMLFKLANIYEKKSSVSIQRLVALIEPVFTVVVGLLVGVVILAMAMPIFDMSSLMGG